MTDAETGQKGGGMESPRCYAAWSRDADVLKESTSGGAFTELAKVVLAKGGVVVGAAYGDGLVVEHRVAHSLDELKALRGVKYVQSVVPKAVYDEMSETLRERRRVMFVGTPCQAAAVRKRFGRDGNLLLCDLVCFGAPPQSLWLKYVRWLEEKKGKRLVAVNPRDKIHGWGRRTYCRYDWADGTTARRSSDFDPYARAFYSTLSFRTCCFACAFRGVGRVSDVTLCDFWNAASAGLPLEALRGGVSGVMVHSQCGAMAMASAALEARVVPLEVFCDGNSPILQSPDRPRQWTAFHSDAEALPFGELALKHGLVVTWWGLLGRRIVERLKRAVASALPERIVEYIRRRMGDVA